MHNPLAEKLKNNRIILASQSPRRKSLLEGMGIPFSIKIKNTDESYPHNIIEAEIAEFLSKKKSDAFIAELKNNEIIITADTIVWYNNKVLNKPKSQTEAIQMLQTLSGNTHKVFTGVTIQSINKICTFSACTHVQFKNLSDTEINFYINEFKPLDKAGAYGIQEWIGYIGIEKIEGCYFNVMGLPTSLLYKFLFNF